MAARVSWQRLDVDVAASKSQAPIKQFSFHPSHPQIGSLEEMIDDNHCIVSTTNGPEYYVNILSIVDRSADDVRLRS